MSHDLLNILSNSNKDIDNQKLMDYLSGKLSEGEKHEVEKWMIDNEFANEAIEGLKQVKQEKDLQPYVDQLNKQLSKYIGQKKRRREKKNLPIPSWNYLAVLMIIALAVIVYLIIHKFQGH